MTEYIPTDNSSYYRILKLMGGTLNFSYTKFINL